MELRQYRYFVAVAEELSFTRAAERLSIAQPPLSQQIAKMERELGVRLLERDHRSVSLTDVGEAFLAECYLLLEQEKRARDTVAWREGRVTGRLRVGCMPSLMAGVLPGALDRFRQALPEVEVVVEELDDADQLLRLAQQRMDIGLGRLEGEQKGVNVHALGAEPLMLALPQDHRLAERRALNLADLSGEDFIMFRRSQAPQVYDAYLGLCMTAGFQMRVGDESAVGDHSMLALVACRRGVAIVPASTAQVKFPRVVYRRMNRPGGVELPISLVWRRRAVPRFTKEFARAVKEQVSSVSHPS